MKEKKSKNTNWGGARKNAGRKESNNKKETVTVRIDRALIDSVKQLKAIYKTGESIDNLINGTDNQDAMNTLQERSLTLVQERDREHIKNISLEGQVRLLKADNGKLKQQITELNKAIYSCQFLVKGGNKCTRKANVTVKCQGLSVHSCLQHSKK